MSNGNGGQAKKRVNSCPHDPASLVAARLRRSGYAFLWGIRCEFNEGVLSLIGNVPTFHLKQVAQSLAMHTPGVREVNNCLYVNGSAMRPAETGELADTTTVNGYRGRADNKPAGDCPRNMDAPIQLCESALKHREKPHGTDRPTDADDPRRNATN